MLTKITFFLGCGALLVILSISIINASELRWLFCESSSYSGFVLNKCSDLSLFLSPLLLLIPFSVAAYFFRFDRSPLKKQVFAVSSVYVVCAVMLIGLQAACYGNWCEVRDDEALYLALFSFLPLSVVFFLSLVTYKIRDEYFWAWWNFARWFTPVIIIVAFLQNMQGGGGGLGIGGAISRGFDALVLGLLYSILVIVSLSRIVAQYPRTRKGRRRK